MYNIIANEQFGLYDMVCRSLWAWLRMLPTDKNKTKKFDQL